MTKVSKEKPNPQLRENAVSSSYSWLKNAKTCWVSGKVGFPVEVEILNIDFENEKIEAKTQYQQGFLPFSELYKSEMSCPCR